MCLEKEQLRAHSRSAGEEPPKEHTRQQSSLAVQAGSKIHLSPVPTAEQSKTRLINFLCFGYSKWPLIVFIWSSTGLWPTKHSFKYLTESAKKRQKAATSCHIFCSISSGTLSESSLRSPTQGCSSRTHVCKCSREKKSGAQDRGERAQTWASFIWKHEAAWWQCKNTCC